MKYSHSPRMSKLRLSGGIAALAVSAVALAACGSSDAGPSSSASIDQSAVAKGELPDLSGQTIVLASYGGSWGKNLMDALGTPFEKLTGAKVVLDPGVDFVKLQTMVKTGNVSWDVLDANPDWVQGSCGKYFEKIDTDAIVKSGTPAEYITNDCAAPSLVGSTALVYDTSKYGDNPPTSWADFFDVSKFPGQRSVLKGSPSVSRVLEAALLADGVSPADLYPLDVDRALKKIDSLGDSITWSPSPADQGSALTSGTVDMCLCFNSPASDAVRNGAKVAPAYDAPPLVATSTWAIAKGAPHKSAAEVWVQWAEQPAQEAKITELSGYGTFNTLSKPQLKEPEATFAVTNPKFAAPVVYDVPWWAKNVEAVTEEFTNHFTR